MQLLKLQKAITHMKVKGLSGNIVDASGIATLQLHSNNNENVIGSIQAYVVPTLMSNLPKNRLNVKARTHIQSLKLADEDFHIPARVDILLGAEFYGRIIQSAVCRLENAPIAQKTTFGWIIFGGYTEHLNHASLVNSVEASVDSDELLQLLTKFWEFEQLPHREYMSQEEHRCEQIFLKSIKVDADGHYVVRMPLMDQPPAVTGTYDLAFARLTQMERRFQKDEELKQKYMQFMREYEQLGHMVKVPADERQSESAVYVPHHSARTTKFRVVFDGSAKRKGGVSINDIQLNGEKVQPELTETFMRFRTHKIALVADITKMYRQIRMYDDQQDLQRILWREPGQKTIDEYRLATQTYGMKSAAFVCVRSLQHCANEFASEFPEVSKAVSKSFYVDDMLSGSHDEKAAIKLYEDLTTMLGQRKLELAKWATNSVIVRQHLKNRCEAVIELSNEETNAVLGIHWNTKNDMFQYKIRNAMTTTNATKGSIASDIARLYDPCGYLTPAIVQPKLLLQRLWRIDTGWDDVIDDETSRMWRDICDQMQKVVDIRIPRRLHTTPQSKLQLHGFADASMNAYGVAFYLRQQCDDIITTNLVFAKSRVAPTKGATIPKLELSACYLMAQLLSTVRKTHNVDIDDCHLWSDSMIALHWIGKQPVSLDVFVGNRVAEIQSLTQNTVWRHVDTKSNPADLVSRGVNATQLVKNHLWWHGPSWLVRRKEEWPITFRLSINFNQFFYT